ncbi:MAG TPA: alpha/beta hydrolase [Ilumatobacteraceae bacterium]|jgi:pimeloyl-ACP methyl ester carboxylesterase
MPQAIVNTVGSSSAPVTLEYETFGEPGNPPLLMIMGFTAQLTLWGEKFCRRLADRGRFVIVFDNRDCGLSTKLDGVEVDVGGVMAAALSDRPDLLPEVPYTLADMADDAAGLLDHLGIGAAHILGASMGGMIAQTFAIRHHARTTTLISIMSTTGDPEVSEPTPEAATALLTPPPPDRAGYLESCRATSVWHSKKYYDEDEMLAQAGRDYDRSFYPEGANRQLAAIYASGRRSADLPHLDVPTLVIHGRDDTLLPPVGGFRTAELIPGANLLFMADMGHDLPEPLWPVIVDAIISHTDR